MFKYDTPQIHEGDNETRNSDVESMAGAVTTATMVETTYSDELSGYDQLPQTD